MSAMKRATGHDNRSKGSRPDGTPSDGRAGKGKTFDKTPSGPSKGYKSREKTDGPSSSGDRPYKSRKPYEGTGSGAEKTHSYKGTREDKPSRPWKRDDESGSLREKRYSDKPTGDRPFKSRKPYEGKPEGQEKHHTYKGSRDEKPTRPWKRDDESGSPREKTYSGKPSGDRSYKSRKPDDGTGHDSEKTERYKGTREEKTSRPWKRDDESGSPREKRYSGKPSGDRPYKSRKLDDGTGNDSEKTERYKGTREEKTSRPWKRDDESGSPREKRYSGKPSGDRPGKGRKSYESEIEEFKPRIQHKPDENRSTGRRKPEDQSDAPRERRARKSDFSGNEPSKRRDDGEFRPKRKFEDKGEPGKYRRDKSSEPAKHKGNYGYSKDGSIRLNKFIANSGVCSRREADVLIESGAVSVNGIIVTELGTKITRDDKVQFGGETLNIEKKVYLLLNKPKGYITTVDDPQDRNTVMMLVKDACRERIYPVGRLDRNTSGLLLFTNDGETAKKLTHPGHKVRKVYHVELNKGLTKPDMIRLTEGIELEDGLMAVDEVAYTGNGEDKKNIGLVIHSGRNRVVRRLFEALEYEVVKLDRVAFANLTKKDLPRGRWRMLEQSEINMLLMI